MHRCETGEHISREPNPNSLLIPVYLVSSGQVSKFSRRNHEFCTETMVLMILGFPLNSPAPFVYQPFADQSILRIDPILAPPKDVFNEVKLEKETRNGTLAILGIKNFYLCL